MVELAPVLEDSTDVGMEHARYICLKAKKKKKKKTILPVSMTSTHQFGHRRCWVCWIISDEYFVGCLH